jgi:dolichol-phosphate mannosyltransferase
MQQQEAAIDTSIVVPLYNEESVLPTLIRRLEDLKDLMENQNLEFILINDGSSDNTKNLINEACDTKGFVGIHLSRNFGHQAAVTAGIFYAQGQYIAVIDGDLQDPPELIPEMIARIREEGADVAYGVRTHRKENWFKRTSYFLFYRLLAVLTPLDIPLDSGDFGVITRQVAEVINSMPEHHRFIRGLRTYAGFKQVPFLYKRNVRGGGEPKYNLYKLIQLAMDGIFTFSQTPLKLSTFFGFLVSLFSILYGLYLLIWRLVMFDQQIPGFATLAVGMFFLGGVQLICIGILGEYIGRIHNEVKGRPPFVVESIYSFDETKL